MSYIPHPLRQMAIIGIFGIVLLVMSACGPNAASSTTGTPAAHSTPTASATAVGGYGNIHGCPSNAIVSTAPKQANVTIQNTDINSTVSAHVGDTIEVRLPFGQKWSGPSSIPTNLEQQEPAGYASISDNVCIWRFVAQSAGTAQLDFYRQALCLKGEMCPMFIANEPFTIEVK